MKLIYCGLFFLFAFGHGKAEEHFSQVDQKVLEVMGLSIKSDLSIIGSDREAVIARLREVATGKIDHIGTASLGADDAQIVLMRLGDDQTLQEVLTQYQQYNSQSALAHIPDMLEWSHQPAAISYLASDFFINNGQTRSVNVQEDSDFAVTAPARSIYSAVITLEIIKRAPEFSPELKAWAKDVYALRFKDPAKFRLLMQAWWNKNKEAFHQRNYSAVQPIDIQSFEPPAPAPVPPLPPEIKPVPNPPEPNAQVTSSLTQKSGIQPTADTDITFRISVIIALSLCLIGGLWYFFRAKK